MAYSGHLVHLQSCTTSSSIQFQDIVISPKAGRSPRAAPPRPPPPAPAYPRPLPGSPDGPVVDSRVCRITCCAAFGVWLTSLSIAFQGVRTWFVSSFSLSSFLEEDSVCSSGGVSVGPSVDPFSPCRFNADSTERLFQVGSLFRSFSHSFVHSLIGSRARYNQEEGGAARLRYRR